MLETAKSWKIWVFTFAALGTMMLLSSCGLDTNTSLTVNDDGSGQRVMQISLAKNQENMEGRSDQMPAYDASIRKYLPPELEFSGLRDNGQAWVGTFTLKFTSIEDYRKKVAAVLAKGDIESAAVQYLNKPKGLVSGYIFNEDFDTTKLLRWMRLGLDSDNLLDSEAQSYFFSGENKAQIAIAGEQIPLENGRIQVEKISDSGFGSVKLLLNSKGGESYDGLIAFEMKRPNDPAAGEKDRGTYLEQLVKKQGLKETELSLAGMSKDSRVFKFSAKTYQELNSTLDAVLGAESTLAVKSQLQSDSGLYLQNQYAVVLDCAEICSPEGDLSLSLFTEPGTKWLSAPGDFDAQFSQSVDSGENLEFTISQPLRFQKFLVKVAAGMDGPISQEIEIRLPTSEVKGLEKKILSHLNEYSPQTKFTVATKDKNTVFTREMDFLENPQHLESSGMSLEVVPADNRNPAWLNMRMDLSAITGSPVAGNIETKVNLASRHSFLLDTPQLQQGLKASTAAWQVEKTSATYSCTDCAVDYLELRAPIKKLNLALLITGGILLLLLLTGGVIAFLQREKIKTWMQHRREAAALRAQQQAAQKVALAQQQAMVQPVPWMPPAGEPGQPPAVFDPVVTAVPSQAPVAQPVEPRQSNLPGGHEAELLSPEVAQIPAANPPATQPPVAYPGGFSESDLQ